MSKEKKKKQSLSPLKKLALTDEEVEGMSKERIEVHLRETVTTPMPWLLDWLGKHWLALLLFIVVVVILVGLGVAIGFIVRNESINFRLWIIACVSGLGWFLNWFFIKIFGWAWLVLPLVTAIVVFAVKKLIKRDILAISRYGTNRVSEYVIASGEEGSIIAIPRISAFGTLIFGKAKAKISDSSWEYIQQNTDLYTHKPVGEKVKTYRLLTVLPEEYSKETVVKRMEGELILNPGCLIREKDTKELLLENIGKDKKEQLANKQILFNLTMDLHKKTDLIRGLQVKIRSVPEDTLQEFARTMMPETTELFFDTYKLLKDKPVDLTPFDTVEAELEPMKKKKSKELDASE